MDGPRFGTPSWLPWLGPILAAGIGAAVGRFGLGGGFWVVLSAALVGGFAPVIGLWLWRRFRRD